MTRRPLSLSQVQHLRKAGFWLAAFPITVAFFAVAPWWPDESLGAEAIEATGFGLIAFAILGRTWCTLYIGGRKKREVVDTGPYSISRNPLYLFSVLGALGIGMCASSVVMGLALAAFTFSLFGVVARQEEAFLAAQFGEAYARYRSRVPRWVGLRGRWREAECLEVRPRLVLTMFRDASLMFLSLPVIEAIEELQLLGQLPVLVHLP